MKWYAITYHCPTCGKVHQVATQRGIPDGPDQAGMVAELYAGEDLPESLALLMSASVICENTGALVKLDDPARLTLWPWGAAGAGK